MTGIWIASRARLARNVAGLKFPARASSDELLRVRGGLAAAIREADYKGWMSPIGLDGTGDSSRTGILAAFGRFASAELMARRGASIVVDKRGHRAVLINEEDHARFVCVLPGRRTASVIREVYALEREVARKVRFSTSERFGYLTASPGNSGLGLRLSALLLLRGLASSGKIGGFVRSARKLGCVVRGAYGEGSEPVSDLYQISNLGSAWQDQGEVEACILGVCGEIEAAEMEARESLDDVERARIRERAEAGAHVLSQMRSAGPAEIGMLCDCTVAASLGMMNRRAVPFLVGLLGTALGRAALRRPAFSGGRAGSI